MAVAGISGYATGQLAIDGVAAMNAGLLATANWAAGTYINSQVANATTKYVVNHTNITARDATLLRAGLTLAGTYGEGGIGSAANVMGKIWNAPNTAIGLGIGLLGLPLGATISFGNNAIQIENIPLMFLGALTLGNTTNYNPNMSPLTSGLHESMHTYQGEVTGPAYLPLNFVGMTASLFTYPVISLRGPSPVHGAANFMEIGPQAEPARVWP